MKRRAPGILATVATILAFQLVAPIARAEEKKDRTEQAYEDLQDLIYDERYQQAYEAAQQFMKTYPKSKWVEAADFWKCYALERSTRAYAESFDCYASFLKKYPDGKWSDDARNEYVKLAKRMADAGDPRGRPRSNRSSCRRGTTRIPSSPWPCSMR